MSGTNNLVVVSDLHCGCRLGLCPPKPVALDDGGQYTQSKYQAVTWAWWEKKFWGEFVPQATNNEPYDVLFNGDVVDGVHHNSTTQISQNLEDQAEIFFACLAPVKRAKLRRIFMVRGTEAHVGKSGVDEERIAKRLGTPVNESGQHAWYDAWIRVGGNLVHALHHIGTTGSTARETSAVNAELVAEFTEALQWGDEPPQAIVRSHRHRYSEVRLPTKRGFAIAVVTPGWQLKTPFSWKIAGARLSPPQFGGLVFRQGKKHFGCTPLVIHLERSNVA